MNGYYTIHILHEMQFFLSPPPPLLIVVWIAIDHYGCVYMYSL